MYAGSVVTMHWSTMYDVSAFAENVRSAHHRILRIGAGLAFETQRLFEIKRNHRGLGELEHEVAKRAHGDLGGNDKPLSFAQLWMASIDFLFRRRDQSVEQVIGLDAKAFASGNLNVGASFVFVRKLVAEFSGATRSERDHLVRKMRVMIGLLVVTESTKSFDHSELRFGLAGVDHIVDFGYIAEMRMNRFAISS
jgi:hypothetical protein